MGAVPARSGTFPVDRLVRHSLEQIGEVVLELLAVGAIEPLLCRGWRRGVGSVTMRTVTGHRSGAMQTRAAVMPERGGRWSIETLEVAEPGPREVRVALAASGICQTDVHARDGFFPSLPWPAVYGHEGAGVVESLGPGVTGLAPGDHVILASPSCGECPECRSGHESYCQRAGALKHGGRRSNGRIAFTRAGRPVAGPFFQQSSFCALTLATERNAVKVPRDLPLDVLAAFPCGVNTGAGAVMNVLRPEPGDSLVVFGVGTVGFAGLLAARLAGCAPIIAVDRHASRLALARELGATHVVDADRPDLVETVRGLAGGRGARFSLEAAGAPAALRAAVEVLAPRGTACLVGSAGSGVEVALEMRTLQQGRAVRGCIQGESRVQAFLPELIARYRDGTFPVDRLVRHYPLEEINEAVRDLLAGSAIKPVLRFEPRPT